MLFRNLIQVFTHDCLVNFDFTKHLITGVDHSSNVLSTIDYLFSL